MIIFHEWNLHIKIKIIVSESHIILTIPPGIVYYNFFGIYILRCIITNTYFCNYGIISIALSTGLINGYIYRPNTCISRPTLPVCRSISIYG